MSIEGDLKDIGLGTIVQALCLERRKGRLWLNHREQEGAIYFDNGEIVHASLNSLQGVEAIYKLLTWNSGWFRLTEHVEIPQKTIKKNWHHLLLDGLRMVDEKHKNGQQTPLNGKQLTKADQQHDEMLENDLIYLMSKLEQEMYRLSKVKPRKLPKATLETLCQMFNEILEFCEGATVKSQRTYSLRVALGKAVEQFPQSRILHAVNNRLSCKTALNLYKSWGDDPADRKHFFRQVCRGVIVAKEEVFSTLAEEFHSHDMRLQWTETYEVFLCELRRTVERVPF